MCGALTAVSPGLERGGADVQSRPHLLWLYPLLFGHRTRSLYRLCRLVRVLRLTLPVGELAPANATTTRNFRSFHSGRFGSHHPSSYSVVVYQGERGKQESKAIGVA